MTSRARQWYRIVAHAIAEWPMDARLELAAYLSELEQAGDPDVVLLATFLTCDPPYKGELMLRGIRDREGAVA